MEPVPEAVMPEVRRSAEAVAATTPTTDDRLLIVLGEYTDRLGGNRPTTVEDCFEIIGDLN